MENVCTLLMSMVFRVVECRYEKFLGNDIWETKYENHNLNEKVVAWRFLK